MFHCVMRMLLVHMDAPSQIFITDGLLLEKRWQPDEWAFIFAHELAHVICGHMEIRLFWSRTKILVACLVGLKGILTGSFGMLSLCLPWLINLWIRVLFRKQELEADELALRLVHHAGYSTQKGFEVFGLGGSIEENTNFLIRLFLSHPPHRLRYRILKQQHETMFAHQKLPLYQRFVRMWSGI